MHAQIEGAPTGWWTDANGNNYYGTPPSSSYDSSSGSSYSSSDSSYSSGSSGGGGYGGYTYDWAGALDSARRDFERGVNDWQRQFQARQVRQRVERERRQADFRRMFQSGNKKSATVNSGSGAAKPILKRSSLENTGRNWNPGILDLRPRAVASQIRSGDNYARKKQWDQAIRHYQEALRVDPKDKTARRKLAEARDAKKKAPPKKRLFSRGTP